MLLRIANIVSALALLFLVSCGKKATAGEISVISEFLVQRDSVSLLQNQELFRQYVDAAIPDTWPGISWEKGIGSDITKIIWDDLDKQFTGSLDLSGSKSLKSIAISVDSIILPNHLEELSLKSAVLTILDISEFKELRVLDLNTPALEILLLPKESNIEKLHISSEVLYQFDIQTQENLKELSLDLPALETIDLSSAKYLKSISFSPKIRCFIDLSHNENLEELSVYGKLSDIVPGDQSIKRYKGVYRHHLIPENIEELSLIKSEEWMDLKRFVNLRSLSLFNVDLKNETLPAGIESINFNECNTDELDITHCSKLTELTINKRIPKGLFEQVIKLEELQCLKINGDWSNWAALNDTSGPETTFLDLHRLINLITLELRSCGLETIDVSGCLELENLDLSDNNLKILNLSNNLRLVNLNTSLNNLDHLSLESNIELSSFTHSGNAMSNVILPHDNKIKSIHFIGENLDLNLLKMAENLNYSLSNSNEKIDLSANNNLKVPELHNIATDVEFINNSQLESLSIYGPGFISTIDLSHKKNLKYFKANNLSVRSIIFPLYESNLNVVIMNNIEIEEMDLSNQNKLFFLDCGFCSLSSLILPKDDNNVLRYLDCSYNFLTELDVSKQKKLRSLEYSGNDLHDFDLANNRLLKNIN